MPHRFSDLRRTQKTKNGEIPMNTAISLAAMLFKAQDLEPTPYFANARAVMAPNFKPGVNGMKFSIAKMITMTTICLVSLATGAPAFANDACSDATLRGDYASTVSGQLFHADGTAEDRQGLVNTHFDGRGYFTQTDYVLNTLNGVTSPTPGPIDPVSGFQNEESGTYHVNPDCTGNLTIHFASPPVPGATGAVIQLFFVLGSHGNWMRTVVVSVTPPSVVNNDITGFTLHSEGSRLGQHN